MRIPAVAGKFYPDDRSQLIRMIEDSFTHPLGPGKIGPSSDKREIKGVLVPHAGYQCSGMTAAHSFKSLAEDGRPDVYIIIGPDHYGIPFEGAICSEPYVTPLGACDIHKKIAARLSETIVDSVHAHRFEHSVEVEVPFIQYIDPDAKIVPIIMSRQTMDYAEKVGKAIREACEGYDAVVIASSDMSHYVPKPVAEDLDMKLLNRACALDIEGMYSEIARYRISACGYGPIAAMIHAVDPKEGKLLKHTDSWDSLNYMKESVVGYASAVFM